MNKLIVKIGVLTAALTWPLCHAGMSAQTTHGNHPRGYEVVAGNSGQPAAERLMLADNKENELKEKLEKDKIKEARKSAREAKKSERNAEREQKQAERAAGNMKLEDRRKAKLERIQSLKQNKPVPAAPQAAAPAVAAPAAAAAVAAPALAPKPAPQPAASMSPLVVKSYPASGVWYAGATLNGYTAYPGKTGRAWFEWGNSPSFGQATAATAFTGEQSIGQPMRVPGRGKYYYRMVAESSGQLVYGQTLTFEAK